MGELNNFITEIENLSVTNSKIYSTIFRNKISKVYSLLTAAYTFIILLNFYLNEKIAAENSSTHTSEINGDLNTQSRLLDANFRF